ncbi:MAG: RIP metalloprotease RseP [Fibrobacter sp.]|nr:RIP metalloprotease RseP [Fibrobacter sp.]
MELTLAMIFNKVLLVVLGIVVLGVLVFIHELGHFLVAKWCGIRVLAFSLGFGTPLLKKTYKGTEYRISAIPFGGYVKMAGENPEEGKSGASDEFTSKPVWQRALVAAAGPLANFIAAFAMLWFMFANGVEEPEYLEHPIIGAIDEMSLSEAAGLRAGDSILTINNKAMRNWEDIRTSFSLMDKKFTISYYRDGQIGSASFTMNESDDLIPKDPFGGLRPPLPAIVKATSGGSPAQKAGILSGDTIVGINGKEIISWYQVLQVIMNYDTVAKAPLSLVVARSGSRVSLEATPLYNEDEKRFIVGITVDVGKKRIVRYPVGVAFNKGMEKTWEYTTMIFDIIKKLVSQEVSPKHLAGPVGIIPMSGGMMLEGLAPILNFMGLVGINLAVLNLMPLIITDGGMLLFLLFEAVRRKPLSLKTQMLLNKIAIAFFLFLFLYVTFNDVNRLPEYFRIFGR